MSFSDQQTWAGTAGGTANAITLTVPDIGNSIRSCRSSGAVIVAATNTGATTAAITGTPPTPIRKLTAGGLAALIGNEFITGNSALYNL